MDNILEFFRILKRYELKFSTYEIYEDKVITAKYLPVLLFVWYQS